MFAALRGGAVWLVHSFLFAFVLKNQNTEVIFETPLIAEATEDGISEEIPID